MDADFPEDNFEDQEDEGYVVEVKQQDREEKNKIKSKFSYLSRPPVDPFFNESSPLVFMQIDVDYYLHKGNVSEYKV